MRAHLYVAAVLFLLSGVLLAGAAFSAPILFDSAASSIADGGGKDAVLGATALRATGQAVTLAAGIFALPCLICGAAMLTRRGWVRWPGIALAATALVFFPLGTLAGAYVLWVLLARRFEWWFEAGLEPESGQ